MDDSKLLGSLEWSPSYAESEVPAEVKALSYSEIVLSHCHTLHLVSFVPNNIRMRL